jgi:hypothetical protein
LQDSILNFHLVLIMGAILLYLFVLCSAAFKSARREFDVVRILFYVPHSYLCLSLSRSTTSLLL